MKGCRRLRKSGLLQVYKRDTVTVKTLLVVGPFFYRRKALWNMRSKAFSDLADVTCDEGQILLVWMVILPAGCTHSSSRPWVLKHFATL